MAQAHIIGGSYQTNSFLWDAGDTVFVGLARGMGGSSLRGQVASVQIASDARKKSFLRATATGLAGAAIAGPIGAVAGVVAGGNGQEVLFSCTLHGGGQFTARGDVRIFELLLVESMKARAEPVRIRATGSILSGSFASGSQLVVSEGVVRLHEPSAAPLMISGQVRNLEALGSPGQLNEIRFHCELYDGRRFEVQGDPLLFESLRVSAGKAPSIAAPLFWLSLIFLAFAVFAVLCIGAFNS